MNEQFKKIDWERYSKDDKKFIIDLTISNREYTSTVAIFIYSTLISISALLISLYSIAISLFGISKLMIYVGIEILLIVILSWILVYGLFRKMTKYWIPSLNKQYQNILKTIYPELFKEGFFY